MIVALRACEVGKHVSFTASTEAPEGWLAGRLVEL